MQNGKPGSAPRDWHVCRTFLFHLFDLLHPEFGTGRFPIKASDYRSTSGRWASGRNPCCLCNCCSPLCWLTSALSSSTIQLSHFPELRGASFLTIAHARRKSLQGRERESI